MLDGLAADVAVVVGGAVVVGEAELIGRAQASGGVGSSTDTDAGGLEARVVTPLLEEAASGGGGATETLLE